MSIDERDIWDLEAKVRELERGVAELERSTKEIRRDLADSIERLFEIVKTHDEEINELRTPDDKA